MELQPPSPTKTTAPNSSASDKRFTRRDSDAPEVAAVNALIRPPSIYSPTGEKKNAGTRVSFHPVPNEYIPRSGLDYGSTTLRRSAFRRSKTFWLMIVLAMAMCLAVGIGIGYAVGTNGARVVPHTARELMSMNIVFGGVD